MEQTILYKFFRGEASPEEERAIIDWLDADVENRKTFDRERDLFTALLICAPTKKQPSCASHSIHIHWASVMRFTAQVAAVILLAVGLSWSYVSQKEEDWSKITTCISTPRGQRLNIRLQDGTSVWLNSEASLEYPTMFAQGERRVTLKGEALFDVTKDNDRPFKIDTYACEVEVLGTRFNVHANEKQQSFSTTLIRGKVKVISNQDPEKQVIMKPRQTVKLLEDGEFALAWNEDPNEYLWSEDIILISDYTFEEALKRMEQCYGVQFDVQLKTMPTIESMGKIRISDGIEHALNILQRSCKFKYTYNQQTNEVTIY